MNSKEAMLHRMVQYWLKGFKDGNLDLKDMHRGRRFVEFDEERLN